MLTIILCLKTDAFFHRSVKFILQLGLKFFADLLHDLVGCPEACTGQSPTSIYAITESLYPFTIPIDQGNELSKNRCIVLKYVIADTYYFLYFPRGELTAEDPCQAPS